MFRCRSLLVVAAGLSLGLLAEARGAEPPPPPKLIPAHPLIAERKFADILRMMDEGSTEAQELFRLHGWSFPGEDVAKIHVPRAFGADRKESNRAMTVLWLGGPDAEAAAALAYAVTHKLSTAHHVELINNLTQPGPYTREALTIIRHHENPRIRAAALAALAKEFSE